MKEPPDDGSFEHADLMRRCYNDRYREAVKTIQAHTPETVQPNMGLQCLDARQRWAEWYKIATERRNL